MHPRLLYSIIFECLGVAWACIFGPYAVWLWKESALFTTPTFQQNIRIDFALCGVVLCSVLIERPLNFYAGINTKIFPSEAFLFFRICLATSVTQGIAWLTWMKASSLYFMFKRAEVQQERKWKKLLDPALGETDELWFEKQRGKFGSPLFWVRLAVVQVAIIASFGCLCVILLGSSVVWSLVNAFLMYVLFLATAYLWIKRAPRFHDSVGLRYQQDWFVISIVVNIVLWVGLYTTAAFWDSLEFRAARYLSNYAYSYWAGYLLLVVPHNHITRVSQIKIETSRETVPTICSEEMKFVAFMDHLLREFAHENLLFIVEAVQFMERFEGRVDMSRFATPRISIAHEIPKSAIVFGEVDGKENEMYMKGLQIHEKYVNSAVAPQEINLSWATRVNWIEYFEKQRVSREFSGPQFDPNGIFELFDDAVKEILALLRGCLSRFQFDENYYDSGKSMSIEFMEGFSKNRR